MPPSKTPSATQLWNERQKRLNALLAETAADRAAAGLSLCLGMVADLHDESPAAVFGSLAADLTEAEFRFRPADGWESVAWQLWHLTRIEDAVGAIGLADRPQVYDADWRRRLAAPVDDTGNALDADQAGGLAAALDFAELLAYRREVGSRTAAIVAGLDPAALRRPADRGQFGRFFAEGVLTQAEGSRWLYDFWRRKTVAGLLSMPITRHQVVHINASLRLRDKARKALAAAAPRNPTTEEP